MVMLADIHTTGKWSGRRIVRGFKRKLKAKVKGKCIWYYRVTLMDGKTISADGIDIIKEINRSGEENNA